MEITSSTCIRHFLLVGLLAQSIPAAAATAHVTGRVSARERIALPPGYVLRVELRDITRQDAASEEIAAVEMRPKHQLPVRYSLAYDPGRIHPAHLYSVSARVLVGARLAFISTRINAVITRGGSNAADIVVQAVRHAAR